MSQVQLATKIDKTIKDSLVDVCEERGMKIGRFLEEAILDKLEEFEDVSELRSLRGEKFRAFSDVIKELKRSGKL